MRDPSILPYRPTAEAWMLDDDDKLLAQIVDTGDKSYLSTPGGGIDEGEEAEEGLRRELIEETGVDPKELELHGKVDWDWSDKWPVTGKQKKRYQQFRGEAAHIFTGEIGAIGEATSQEGDAWDELPRVELEDALQKVLDEDTGGDEHMANYRSAQVQAIKSLMKKRQRRKGMSTRVADMFQHADADPETRLAEFEKKKAVYEADPTDKNKADYTMARIWLAQATGEGAEALEDSDDALVARVQELEDRVIDTGSIRREPDMHKKASVNTSIAFARRRTDTSPTMKQIEAENYKKGHVNLFGLNITLENPKGSFRRGINGSGVAWSVKMKHDYGYVKRSEGADGDHVDVFIGDNHKSEIVYVVNQYHGAKFDEVKVMLGFDTEEAAKKGYMRNYAKNWKGLHSIVPCTLQQFQSWVYDKKASKKEFPMEKKANIKELKKAKTHSDKGEYKDKAKIMRKLMKEDPAAFVLDLSQKPHPGIKHKRTGFRMHIPFKEVPAAMLIGS